MADMSKLAEALRGFLANHEQLKNGLSSIVSQESGGYGVRPDGTPKDKGWLGELTFNDGSGEVGRSTELSAESTMRDGSNLLYPLITPNQGFKDMSNLLTGGRPTDGMYDRAINHALSRKMTGRSPFAGIGEQQAYGAQTKLGQALTGGVP